ncbi:iron-containing alcohol dehydrogenase [Alicyclobacillus fastidiosus]|uniref:Iron-containing alcohol dehydrogenase n=1 Tax=Alicyclobacillus fastidiosus TaxID=392011 RepID=A0ABV5A939_9BACL|nr:iron-containing alcohol dehydrogenase [Alicyclobacillus fastidiosus]WEH10741.1 iron-containing alcohol dehydrogenase [Alicyclobacillus fastidiosus]
MLMNRVFRYELPTLIEFGIGALQNLASRVEELGGTKVLVVGDPGVSQAGLLDRVEDVLERASIQYVEFTNIQSDPDIESVDEGIRLAKEESCDIVVGVGGGSALDTAKAIGLMLGNSGHITDYVGLNKVPNRGAPVIAMPTAAGTGSEVTVWSVLSNRAAKEKVSIGSVFNCPALALLDPELTVSLPPTVTAATGMDALTHAIESYVNKATQPISECLARQAIDMIAKNLRLAVVQGDNLTARYNMSLASLIAAMAFNSTRLGLSHALAIPLGAHFHIPHGVVNAILLPEVMQFNVIGNIDKYQDIGRIFDGSPNLSARETAEYSAVAVRRLKEDVGIRQSLSDYGVRESDLKYIAEEAMLSGNVPVNPRKPTIEDLMDICRAAMEQ